MLTDKHRSLTHTHAHTQGAHKAFIHTYKYCVLLLNIFLLLLQTHSVVCLTRDRTASPVAPGGRTTHATSAVLRLAVHYRLAAVFLTLSLCWDRLTSPPPPRFWVWDNRLHFINKQISGSLDELGNRTQWNDWSRKLLAVRLQDAITPSPRRHPSPSPQRNASVLAASSASHVEMSLYRYLVGLRKLGNEYSLDLKSSLSLIVKNKHTHA